MTPGKPQLDVDPQVEEMLPAPVSGRRGSKPEVLSVASPGPCPPPRPPRHSKSLGHIPKLLDGEKTPSKTRRRRSASSCKSTNSLFECSEGCFSVGEEAGAGPGQLVTITTGPMVL